MQTKTLNIVDREIYFPIEFQSSDSKEFLFRFGQYVFILYRALFDEGVLKTQDGSTLVLPILIYDGDKPWTACSSMRTIHDPIVRDTEEDFRLQILFDYFVVDVGRIDPKLLDQDSLPGRLFRLERVKNENDLVATLKDIATRFRQEKGHEELAHILLCLVKRVVLKRLEIDEKQFEEVYELEEFGTMLENVLPDWEARIRKDAEQQAEIKLAEVRKQERKQAEIKLAEVRKQERKQARKQAKKKVQQAKKKAIKAINESKNQIAKTMLDLNEPLERIITFTGLKKEDILALKDERS